MKQLGEERKLCAASAGRCPSLQSGVAPQARDTDSHVGRCPKPSVNQNTGVHKYSAGSEAVFTVVTPVCPVSAACVSSWLAVRARRGALRGGRDNTPTSRPPTPPLAPCASSAPRRPTASSTGTLSVVRRFALALHKTCSSPTVSPSHPPPPSAPALPDRSPLSREKLLDFLWSVKQPDGSFVMHVGGEVDVR